MQEIDYKKWAKMDSLKVWQGIYLLLGEEPDTAEFLFDRTTAPRDCEFMKKFGYIADLAYASIKRGTLKTLHSDPEGPLFCDLIPSVFLHWTKEKEIDIPECLLPLMEALIDKKNVDTTECCASGQAGVESPDFSGISPEIVQAKNDSSQISSKLSALLSNENDLEENQAEAHIKSVHPGKKQTRVNGLHEVIKKVLDSGVIKNIEIWRQLASMVGMDGCIIKAVTSWCAQDAHISWCSNYGYDQKMAKNTFQTLISKLKKSH